MPQAAKRICRHPTCSNTEPCPEHTDQRRKEYEKNRGPAHERGYDHQWRRVRQRYLSKHPMCEDCLERGDVTEAVDVHHKVPVKVDRGMRLDFSNLRALCRSCHRKREASG